MKKKLCRMKNLWWQMINILHMNNKWTSEWNNNDDIKWVDEWNNADEYKINIWM